MKFDDFIIETFNSLTHTKNQWVDLSDIPDAKHDPQLKQNLFDLVQHAYTKCMGEPNVSIKTPNYVLANYYNFWEAIDIDENPDAEACIFGRKQNGIKLAGIGHNGEKLSKSILVNALVQTLRKDGYWMEACGRVAEILRHKGAPIFNHHGHILRLFPGEEIIKWNGDGSYIRTISGTKQSDLECVFGFPNI